MEIRDLFVDFESYCKICKHHDKAGTEDPCNECISTPVNQNSTKPVFWKEMEQDDRENARKKDG